MPHPGPRLSQMVRSGERMGTLLTDDQRTKTTLRLCIRSPAWSLMK